MKFIGRIADGSTECEANVILIKDAEKYVCSENLVLIKNGGEIDSVNEVIGVLRSGVGKNEFLNPLSYRPDVAYTKYGGEPSHSRDVFFFKISLIGSIEGGQTLDVNRKIIAPGSPVYIFEDNENPLGKYIAPKVKTLSWLNAYLEGHKSWRIPADATFIPYHVGVFGTTGSGKSMFTKDVLIPFYLDNGYNVLVLDWSGVDYVPYMENNNIVRATELEVDGETVLEYLCSLLPESIKDLTSVKRPLEAFTLKWKNKIKNKTKEEIYSEIKEFALNNAKRNNGKGYVEYAFEWIKPENILPLTGTTSVQQLIELVRERQLVVVDLSGFETNVKLTCFRSIARFLEELMTRGENLNLALIIDEAPQYTSSNESCDLIKDLAALGRKHKLNLTLLSQGVAGEIGINASVRRNLNTNFFGKLHPLDVSEKGGAEGWLVPYDLEIKYMLNLKPGRFYFTGLMNPSPTPLLITFDLQGV
ncbi:MAG: DUF87 domain-containing protein [Nitrososphaeria archaeon]